VPVLRDAMAVDSLDKCGIYFGSTARCTALQMRETAGIPLFGDFPALLSVEVQTIG